MDQADPTELGEDGLLNKLASRSPNILCFGLIRKHKWVEEAISLAKKIQIHDKVSSKVVVAGKVMSSSFLYFRDLMQELFNISKKAIHVIVNQQLQLFADCDKEVFSKLHKPVDLALVDAKLFLTGKTGLNTFCQQVYHELAKSYPEKVKSFEMHCNVPEIKLKEISLQCRYAIKLDNKGMANNASTIISCFGWYLPTITYCGLLTAAEFKLGGKYSDIVIMQPEGLVFIGDEVRPRQDDEFLDLVCSQILSEPPEIYRRRLQQLRQLRQAGVFSVERAANALIDEAISPLIQSANAMKGFGALRI